MKNKCLQSPAERGICNRALPRVFDRWMTWRKKYEEWLGQDQEGRGGSCRFWVHEKWLREQCGSCSIRSKLAHSFLPSLLAPSKLRFGLSCHVIYTWSAECLSWRILPIDCVGCVWNSRGRKEELAVMIVMNVEMARPVESRLYRSFYRLKSDLLWEQLCAVFGIPWTQNEMEYRCVCSGTCFTGF